MPENVTLEKTQDMLEHITCPKKRQKDKRAERLKDKKVKTKGKFYIVM